MIENFGLAYDEKGFFLRYCSCCLKKFVPNPADVRSDRIKTFVPTIDEYARPHFAYVELPRSVVVEVYTSPHKMSLDLNLVGHILHIEIGDMPSQERAIEIIDFYSHEELYHYQTHNSLIA